MKRRFEIAGQDRFALVYEMFGVGAQIAAQQKMRSMADVRSEVRVMDALDAASSATTQSDEPRVLPARMVTGPVVIELAQPEHELLARYLELAAPAWHISRARDVLAVIDTLAAAERVE